MKICFIYSGLSRTLIESIKQLNNKITNTSIQYDIYIHTELNEIDTSYLHKKLNIETTSCNCISTLLGYSC